MNKMIFDKDKLIKSPLNYVGGKYKLLPQILPLFPDNINTFVDLFAGGCNVGVNVKANRIICNDIISQVIELFQILHITDKDTVFKNIQYIIDYYNLSDSTKQSYIDYGCNSSDGLGKYNKEAYLSLREVYNKLPDYNVNKIFAFYVMTCYSFSNQIRFNSKGEFNMPYGKRDFNKNMREKLSLFVDKVQNINIEFTNMDYKMFNISSLNKDDFIYSDPPYLVTCASYNEQNGWNESHERNLLELLDKIHKQGIRFALSNVLESKGKSNDILKEWAKQYIVNELNYNYNNCNYQVKDKTSVTREVLITNY